MYSSKGMAVATATFFLVICAVSVFAQTAYVPEATNRVDINFNQNWAFNRGDVSGAQALAFDDASWEKVNLPHSVRLEPKVSGGGNYQGIAWYRKSFTLDAKYSGRKVFIEFEGAMGNTDIWINGTALPSHYGGYLPFTVDVTASVKFDGSKNVIAAKVNNSDDPNTPPGKPQANLDYAYWGGIYRNVFMHIMDKTHITDAVYANKVADGGVFVTYPSVTAASATVQVKTNVKNENAASKSCIVKTTIVDSANLVVATATTTAQAIAPNADYTFTQSLTVTGPKLWHPNRPYLYKVYSAVNDGAAYVEHFKTRVGIRTIKMVPGKNGFSINGAPLELFGANYHPEYLYIGYSQPNNLHYRDAKKLKEGGMNFTRFCSVCISPAFLDACDELGILCDEPIPGWQNFGGTVFQQRSLQTVHDMMRRDRNHPSIILWETNLNESYNQTVAFAQSCYDATHAEYPGNQCYATANAYGNNAPGMLYDVRFAICDGVKPGFVREWGDNWWETMPDTTGTRCARRFGEYDMMASLLIKDPSMNGTWSGNDAGWCNMGASTVSMGTCLWAFIDNNSGTSKTLSGMGMLDADRYPKFTYWWFQSQRDPALKLSFANSGPMVKILSYWTQGSPKPVKIATNCQQLKVYLNDALVATLAPPTSTYPNVHHPLFTATLTWAAGSTLRADGLINNVVVASHTLKAPGTANHVELVLDTMGVQPVADGSDLFMVWAKVCDANGAVVPPKSGPAVTMTITGPGTIVGNNDTRVRANPNTAEAGIAAFLIRTTQTPGTINLSATAPGLTAGTASITTLPFNDGTVNIALRRGQTAGTSAAPVQERTFTLMGGVGALPDEFAKKGLTVTVYDLSGKTIFSGKTGRAQAEFAKKTGKTPGVLIVKVKGIK